MPTDTSSKWQGFALANREDVSLTEGVSDDSWWKILCGDSRLALDLLPAESVNCVVTSPPYYWQRDYKVESQIGLEPSIQGYVENLRAVFRGLKRVLTKDGTVFLNLGDTYYSAKGEPRGPEPKHRERRMTRLRAVDTIGLGIPRKSLIGIPWRVGLALIDDGWTLRSSVIWRRNNSIPEPSAKDRPWRTYEFIFILSKTPRYYFNRGGLDIKEEDVWLIEPERNSKSRGTHYAPYPSALVERCLNCGCPEDGVVLDPFLGGGTTMSVALSMGRSAVGVELNPDFCQLVTDRLQKSEGQQQPLPQTARAPDLAVDRVSDGADAQLIGIEET